MASADEDFLSRWSRRKRAVRTGAPVEDAPAVASAPPAANDRPVGADEAETPPEPLPPVEDLTPESDFTPFMDSKVDPGVRREALKKLFSDPRFNVMDRLDIYIDDYSIPDPMPPEWLGQLAAMSGLGDVPGRLKAEREARERALELAQGDSSQVPAAREPGVVPADAPPIPLAEGGRDDDEGQAEALPDPSGCATPLIPAQKMGD